MERKAIIVQGHAKNNAELIEDKRYVDAYRDFFLSNAGGAFESNEVIIYTMPALADLQAGLKRVPTEFSVIIFIGHGADQDNSQLFKLNSTEIIQPGQLEFASDKELVIMESCRNLVTTVTVAEQQNRVSRFKAGGKLLIPISKTDARALYDTQISKCDPGLVICYACDLDEKACGYFFIKDLLDKAFIWHNDSSNKAAVLDIQSLFRSVVPDVSKKALVQGIHQIPVITGSNQFPFAVSKY